MEVLSGMRVALQGGSPGLLSQSASLYSCPDGFSSSRRSARAAWSRPGGFIRPNATIMAGGFTAMGVSLRRCVWF